MTSNVSTNYLLCRTGHRVVKEPDDPQGRETGMHAPTTIHEPNGVDPAYRAKVVPLVVLGCLAFWIGLSIIAPKLVAVVFGTVFVAGCVAALVIGSWRKP